MGEEEARCEAMRRNGLNGLPIALGKPSIHLFFFNCHLPHFSPHAIISYTQVNETRMHLRYGTGCRLVREYSKLVR